MIKCIHTDYDICYCGCPKCDVECTIEKQKLPPSKITSGFKCNICKNIFEFDSLEEAFRAAEKHICHVAHSGDLE